MSTFPKTQAAIARVWPGFSWPYWQDMLDRGNVSALIITGLAEWLLSNGYSVPTSSPYDWRFTAADYDKADNVFEEYNRLLRPPPAGQSENEPFDMKGNTVSATVLGQMVVRMILDQGEPFFMRASAGSESALQEYVQHTRKSLDALRSKLAAMGVMLDQVDREIEQIVDSEP